MDRFLTAKHWQLFLLTFGIPMIIQFIMMGTMMSSIASESNPNPTIIFNYMSGAMENGTPPNPAIFALIAPLHFFSMCCIFYCLYFVAKTIKTVELQREVKFSDFAGEFFMIWFYPIGIWLIQPKINKMMEK